ncbi:hypothetical protein Taro_016247 [Colocasia esculenta]|uniref:Uncharacterized protein n=1 Tax=Colocasia esculenta TaxID=4460 RepID=A0A843UN17_COLES|nr:hypothetical protein [Colocasia esculenta]
MTRGPLGFILRCSSDKELFVSLQVFGTSLANGSEVVIFFEPLTFFPDRLAVPEPCSMLKLPKILLPSLGAPPFIGSGLSRSFEDPVPVICRPVPRPVQLLSLRRPGPLVAQSHKELSKDDDIDDWDYELDVTDIPILDPNWDPDDPRFNIPFDDLMEMMRDLLPTINQAASQDVGAAIGPVIADAPAALPTEDSLTPAVTGQGNPLPMPDPGVANNDEGGSFVPLPLVSDLPVAVKEVEVPVKPSGCPSDKEDSRATSPLIANEPASSETCVISGDHVEIIEPLSGLARSPEALGALEVRLAALRSEAVDTTSQISMVRDQQASILLTQRDKSASATLLRVLASHLDRELKASLRAMRLWMRSCSKIASLSPNYKTLLI